VKAIQDVGGDDGQRARRDEGCALALEEAGGGEAGCSKVVRCAGGTEVVSAGPTRTAARLAAEGFGLAIGGFVVRVMG
jgi:hypothetical protein